MQKARTRMALGAMSLCQAVRRFGYSIVSTNRLASGRVVRNQPLHLLGRGTIRAEGVFTIGFFPSPFFLSSCCHLEARHPNSAISIGDRTHINNNFVAICEHTSITIGRNCRIGTGVEVLDSDFHGLEVADRSRSLPEWARPVVIGNDVFIGSNARILKGVTIGDGSVIANGSVVTRDVPARVIAGGIPARVLRKLA